MYVYVIISLFLFLREFTRVKWSENENGRRERWRVEGEESLSLSFPKGDAKELTRLVRERWVSKVDKLKSW